MFDNKRFQFKKKSWTFQAKYSSSQTSHDLLEIAVYQIFFSIFRNDLRFVDYLSQYLIISISNYTFPALI